MTDASRDEVWGRGCWGVGFCYYLIALLMFSQCIVHCLEQILDLHTFIPDIFHMCRMVYVHFSVIVHILHNSTLPLGLPSE